MVSTLMEDEIESWLSRISLNSGCGLGGRYSEGHWQTGVYSSKSKGAARVTWLQFTGKARFRRWWSGVRRLSLVLKTEGLGWMNGCSWGTDFNQMPQNVKGCFLLRKMGSPTLEVFKQKKNVCCKDGSQTRLTQWILWSLMTLSVWLQDY